MRVRVECASVGAAGKNPGAIEDIGGASQSRDLCRDLRRICLHFVNRVTQVQVTRNTVLRIVEAGLVLVTKPQVDRKRPREIDIVLRRAPCLSGSSPGPS